jgi:Glyoxalase superfamily protein
MGGWGHSYGPAFGNDARAPICPRTMHSDWMACTNDYGMRPPIPVLRMYDVVATRRFYVDDLGFTLDWQASPAA